MSLSLALPFDTKCFHCFSCYMESQADFVLLASCFCSNFHYCIYITVLLSSAVVVYSWIFMIFCVIDYSNFHPNIVLLDRVYMGIDVVSLKRFTPACSTRTNPLARLRTLTVAHALVMRCWIRVWNQIPLRNSRPQYIPDYRSFQFTRMSSLANPRANPATPEFLTHLKSLYPTSGQQNPWYIIAAVSFSAGNEPSAVPSVFKRALDELEAQLTSSNASASDAHGQKLLLARKIREALFKSGLTSGYSKAINSLVALNECMPEELKDTKTLRDTTKSLEEYAKDGKAFFDKVYGETATSVQGLLDAASPDMGWFSNTIGYGLTYGYTEILSELETLYMLVASLIATDTPRQIGWHLDNARRSGATLEQAKAVRAIAMEVSIAAGVRWKESVPEVKETL
ncbi:hypothetical protein VKT23_000669 [Stygiomarasmius scandens]|uniref:Carboxymuconolactone decarboxylase-like domain-containing protein n=1 Tax=Marasmiellus scandens TaxID=2682957 RepID=A0ABR1K4Z9_9AGAR